MPTKTELAKFSVRGAVTASSGNTFTQVAIQTNLAAQGDMMFIGTGLWMNLDPNGPLVSADEVSAQLCYTTQTAIIGPDNPDWIWGRAFRYDLTTSGGAAFEKITYTPVNFFPLATPTLYLAIQGVSMAQAASVSFKLAGYMQKVSTTDFFRIANLR